MKSCILKTDYQYFVSFFFKCISPRQLSKNNEKEMETKGKKGGKMKKKKKKPGKNNQPKSEKQEKTEKNRK